MATALPTSTSFLGMLQGLLGTDTEQNVNTTQDLNTAKTGTSSTSTSADLTGLNAVLQKQLAGITPDQISAIYQEGSKSVPNLVNTYADAMGNRSRGNTALGNSVSDLNSSILAKIAELNTSLTNNAGTTAANIGNLTKATTSTENSNVAQTGTTGQNTVGSTQIDNQAALNALLGMGVISGIGGLTGGTGLGDALGSIGGAIGIGNGTNALTQLGIGAGIGGTTAGATAATAYPVATSALPVATTLAPLGSSAGAVGGAAAAGGTAASEVAGISAATGIPAGELSAAMATNPALALMGPAAAIAFLMTPAGQQLLDGIDSVGTSVGSLLFGSSFGQEDPAAVKQYQDYRSLYEGLRNKSVNWASLTPQQQALVTQNLGMRGQGYAQDSALQQRYKDLGIPW